MTSSIFKIIFTTCAASRNCCFLLCRVSMTFCSRMSLVPRIMQSTPSRGFDSCNWAVLTFARVSMGESPEFSASAIGMPSRASANARQAYCSNPTTESAALLTARAAAISGAPPPYTTRLSRTRLRTMQRASWMLRLISSIIILLPPRTKMVTAFELEHCSTNNILSLVVPKPTSRTRPALPNFSGVSSVNRGTMRPPVAMATSSSSTPPTQRTAGS
mmetsp:Transcript_49891/g.117301  ORF Transcript_49891/g.117301 Transcript_49891/m.117301 type:complete len:217 (-) Transcript_49891:951-1601(-)